MVQEGAEAGVQGLLCGELTGTVINIASFEGERAAAGEVAKLVIERAAVNSQRAVRIQRAGPVVEGAVGERQRGPVGDDNPCWLSSPAALMVWVLAASMRPLPLLTACALRISPLPVAARSALGYC